VQELYPFNQNNNNVWVLVDGQFVTYVLNQFLKVEGVAPRESIVDLVFEEVIHTFRPLFETALSVIFKRRRIQYQVNN
jgi:hypothetical protein